MRVSTVLRYVRDKSPRCPSLSLSLSHSLSISLYLSVSRIFRDRCFFFSASLHRVARTKINKPASRIFSLVGAPWKGGFRLSRVDYAQVVTRAWKRRGLIADLLITKEREKKEKKKNRTSRKGD